MIFEIDKSFDSTRLSESLNYQYSKMEKGVGELIESSVFSEEKAIINQAFENHIEHFSPRSTVAKYHQIVASFNPDDNLNHDQQREVISTWMEAMQYDQTHYAIFRHNDTDKVHYHILATSVKQDGTKLNTFNDFSRSEAVTRNIERNYNLVELNTDPTKVALAKPTDQYAVVNAIKRLPKQVLTHHMFDPIENIKFKGDDQALFQLYHNKNKEKVYADMVKFMEDNKLLKKSNATYLKGLLHQHIRNSRSYEQFTEKLKRERIYLRKVFNSKGSALVYGIPSKGIYFKDYQLADQLNEKNLKQLFLAQKQNSTPVADIDLNEANPLRPKFKDVSKFVKTMASRAAKYSDDLKSFESYLGKYQIEISTQIGRVGEEHSSLKAISYSHNGFTIKGSAIQLSAAKIRGLLNQPIPDDPNSKTLRTIRGKETRQMLIKSLYASNSLSQLYSDLKKRGIKVTTISSTPKRNGEIANIQLSNGPDQFSLSDFNLGVEQVFSILEESHKRNLGVFINSKGKELSAFKKFKKDIFKQHDQLAINKLNKDKEAVVRSLRKLTFSLSRVGASDAAAAAYQEQLDDLRRMEYLR